MSIATVALLVIGVQVINVLVILLGAYIISKVYTRRLSAFAAVVRDAMTLRDAQIRKLQAQFARAITMDTDLFDHALEDDSDMIGDKYERAEENK